MTVPPAIRPATVGDARAIAEIRVEAWRATYAGVVPASILERMDVGRNEAWLRGLLAAPEDRRTLVVETAPDGSRAMPSSPRPATRTRPASARSRRSTSAPMPAAAVLAGRCSRPR